MFYLLSFVYGAAIGSFVLLVATRLGVAKTYRSRSKCLSCGEALSARDLIPILSYLFLRGRCRYCKTPYGKMSLLVEAGFGLLFVLLYKTILIAATPALFFVWLLYYTVLFVALGVIGLYDLRHTYVPVTYLALFLAASLLMLIVEYHYAPIPATLLGPFIVSFPFLVIWLISKGRALGFGDVLLFVGVGAFFGIEQGLAVVLISVWLGALVGIGTYLYKLLKKRPIHSTAIPFVPFIVSAFFIVLFTDLNIFSIASYFA